MRALIILCACVTLVKCGAKVGPTATTTTTKNGHGSESRQSTPRFLGIIGSPVGPTMTTTTTKRGFGSESRQSASRILGIIGSPVVGPFGHGPINPFPRKAVVATQTAHSKRQVSHANFINYSTATSPYLGSSSVGEASATQAAHSKRQVSQADAINSSTATSPSSGSSSEGETSATQTDHSKIQVSQEDAINSSTASSTSSGSSYVGQTSVKQTAHSKIQMSQADAINSSTATSPSSGSSSVGDTSATDTSISVATAEAALFTNFVASSNQLMGILQPSSLPSRSNDILSKLLPEFIDITNKLESRGATGNGRAQAELIVKSFMPLMRKVMIINAEAEERSLTVQEIDAINFAAKTVGPLVSFGYDISDHGKGFINPSLPRNDVPNDFYAQMMVDLLPDLTHIVNQIKEQYGGWPGSAVEVVTLFIPFARRVVESEARLEGRFITKEELDFLRFGEEVVPILMKYAQECFETGKSLEAAEKYNVVDVVQNAWEKLNKDPKF